MRKLIEVHLVQHQNTNPQRAIYLEHNFPVAQLIIHNGRADRRFPNCVTMTVCNPAPISVILSQCIYHVTAVGSKN